MFSGKIEAELERLDSVSEAVAVRIFTEEGAEALGIAICPGPDFDAEDLRASLQRSLRGIGDIVVKTIKSVPKHPNGQPDRKTVESEWFNLAAAAIKT